MANEALLERWMVSFEHKYGIKPPPEVEAQMREQVNALCNELKPDPRILAAGFGMVCDQQELKEQHDKRWIRAWARALCSPPQQ